MRLRSGAGLAPRYRLRIILMSLTGWETGKRKWVTRKGGAFWTLLMNLKGVLARKGGAFGMNMFVVFTELCMSGLPQRQQRYDPYYPSANRTRPNRYDPSWPVRAASFASDCYFACPVAPKKAVTGVTDTSDLWPLH